MAEPDAKPKRIRDAETERLTGPKPPRFSGRSAIFGSVDFPLKRNESAHGQVTVLSTMKDEAPFVIEWVAHHLAVGFTDILVYTNDCSDGTVELLLRLEELGLLHHRANVIAEGKRPHPSALGYAEEEPVICGSDWLLVLDADEFLTISHGDGSIDGLIGAAKEKAANGIVITWRIFGSNGVRQWSRAPVTEQYLRAAPPMWNKGWGVKTLFTFDPEYWKLGMHRPHIRNRHIETEFPDRVKWLTGSGNVMEDFFKFRGWRSIARTLGYDWVQMNHYAIKSAESYALRRLRGNANLKPNKYNSDYWALQDRNEVGDETILRYREKRSAIMAQLLADPVLHRLHNAAHDRVDARLAELRGTPAYGELLASLEEAAEVPISQITAKPPQPRDREKIAALMSDVEKRRNTVGREARKSEAKASAAIVPTGVYVRGVLDAEHDVPLEWALNRSTYLPLDPRIFTPVGMDLVRAGRFERALGRRLPSILPNPSRLLEIGAGCGFLAVHLAKTRGGSAHTLVDDNPGMAQTIRRVLARNELAESASLRLISTLPSADRLAAICQIAAEVRPDAMILGDPALAGAALVATIAALPAPLPPFLFITGRLLELGFADMPAAETALAQRGYASDFDFAPTVARGFRMTG